MVDWLKMGITVGAMAIGASAHKKINIAVKIKESLNSLQSTNESNKFNEFIEKNDKNINSAIGAFGGYCTGRIISSIIPSKAQESVTEHKKNSGFIGKTMMGLGITACLGAGAYFLLKPESHTK